MNSSINPDFDAAYEQVVSWWLEIDNDNVVCREIAFDASAEVIAAAPLGDNHRIFTDTGSAPEGLGADVEPSAFELAWEQFSEKWRYARFAKQ